MKRLFSLLTISALILSLFCSCNVKPAETDNSTEVAATEATSEVEVTEVQETVEAFDGGSYYQAKIYEHEDIDGNGVKEYAKTIYTDGSEGSACEYYFNDELIYTAFDSDLMLFSMSSEYVDLDNDSQKEIFIHLDPMVNSMPGVKFVVLDYSEEEGWHYLTKYVLEDFGLLDSFPIRTDYNPDNDTITISCDGYDETCICDLVSHYNSEDHSSQKEDYYRYKSETPDDIGGIMCWGLWEIEVKEYNGKPCLMATQGVYGTDSKWDEICELNIYFDYEEDESSLDDINIKYIDYQIK